MTMLMVVMIRIFDPGAIVLGGGMFNIERLSKNIPMLIPKYTFLNQVKTKNFKKYSWRF
jgi:hypothetical protein